MNGSGVLKVFYDGACGVCSSEMNYYRSIADKRVEFIDISSIDFEAQEYGKTIEDFHKELHVCDRNNCFYTGVEAFRELWKVLPSPFYPGLAAVAGLPFINLGLRCGYAVFARFRYLWPASKSGSCAIPPPAE